MKRLLFFKICLLLVLLPVMKATSQTGGQQNDPVFAGETSVLSVVEFLGHSYFWELYTEAAGLVANFATSSGNCTVSDAYFEGGNAGSSVTVMWVKPGIYFFKVTAFSDEGCMNLKVGKIEVIQPKPTAEFLDSPAICKGNTAVVSVLLKGEPPFTLTYTDGNSYCTLNNLVNHTLDILVNPAATTSYWITEVVDMHGYPNTEVVGPCVITVHPLPDIIAANITHAFEGQPNGQIELIANSNAMPLEYSIDSINWQSGNILTGLLPGSYIARVRDANMCVSEIFCNIYNIVLGEIEIIAGKITGCEHAVVESPVVVFGFNNIMSFTLELEYNPDVVEFKNISNIHPSLLVGMVGSMVQKTGTLVITFESNVPVTIPSDQKLFSMQFDGLGPGSTLLDWQKPKCVFLAAGNYPLPTIYTHGEIEIISSPNVLALGGGSHCEGSELTLTAQSLDNQEVTYTWYGPMGKTHSGPTWPLGYLALNQSGNYILMAVNGNGCESIIEASIDVKQLPEVSLEVYTDECMNGPVLLEPGIWYTAYRWQDGSTQSSFLATQEGDYWVEVTDENGCTNIAEVSLVPCALELLVPNAFTPNGDGLNDVFMPVYTEVNILNYKMLIYNRWGQQLFESNQITHGWDGIFSSQLLSVDVYTYVITYELPAHFKNRKTQRLQGVVTLVR